MTAAELRAMVAQGPAVVMVAKDDMLKLLDERDRARAQEAVWKRICECVMRAAGGEG